MKKLFLFIGLFSLSISAGAQQQVLSEIEANIRNANFMAETVFLHTDKSLYVAGETIWFKAYVLNRYTQQLQDISATIYVELLNNENIRVWQTRIKASEGIGKGSFNISYQFASGYYKLRAYTYWMESAPESFFEQQLTIINTLRPLDTLAFQSAISTFSVVPENGRLTSGIQNSVIFRYGNQNNFYGYLKTESGDTVLKFAPDYAGAGSFSFVPEAGLKYFAVIANNQGKSVEKELSVTAGPGYYISTKESGDNLLVETQTNNSGNETLYLIINKGSQISYSGTIAPDRKTAAITIPKTILPYGVSEIRLYNSLREEKYHKWVYRAPATQRLLQIDTDRKSYSHRNNVQINLEQLKTQQEFPTSLSVAVYRQSDPGSGSVHIDDYLATSLTEPIDRIYIDANPEVVNNLIVLKNNIVISKGQKVSTPEFAGHFLTVKVTDKASGKPEGEIPVYISVLGTTPQTRLSYSDDEGNAYFNLRNLYGHDQLILTTDTAFQGKVQLTLSKSFVPTERTQEFAYRPLPQGILKAIEPMHQNIVLQHNFSTAGIFTTSPAPAKDSTPFFGTPYKTYLLDNFKRFTTMEEVLREYVQEVNVRIKQKDYSFQMLSRQLTDLGKYMGVDYMITNAAPLVLLDGVPIFDMNKIIAYDPLKVRKLDIVADRYLLNKKDFGGIMSFTTYNHNFEGFELNPNDVVVDFIGWQQATGFPKADYTSTEHIRSRIPDFRQLLLWEPDIRMDSSSNSKIDFYTGDDKGKYIVVVQGISADGKPIYQTTDFEVK